MFAVLHTERTLNAISAKIERSVSISAHVLIYASTSLVF